MEQKAIVERLRGTEKKEGMTAEEALELERVLSVIKGIDLDRAIEQKQAEMLPVERAIARLNNGGSLVRRAKAKSVRKKKAHWKTRQARKRAENQLYYARRLKDRRREELAEKLKTAEGWWEHVSGTWKRKRVGLKITKEEWLTEVWPKVEGRIFITYRYNTKEAMSLGNMLVKDSDTDNVLFDGKEYALRKNGYIL